MRIRPYTHEKNTLHFDVADVPHRTWHAPSGKEHEMRWGMLRHEPARQDTPFVLMRLLAIPDDGWYIAEPPGLYIAQPDKGLEELVPFWVLADKGSDTGYKIEISDEAEQARIFKEELIPAAIVSYKHWLER